MNGFEVERLDRVQWEIYIYIYIKKKFRMEMVLVY